MFAGPVLAGQLSWEALAYAVVSLTVVRVVPVAIGLAGTRFRPATVAFMGWFGPRGLASVVFTLIAVEALHGEGAVAPELFEVATWTILLSVFAHGLSARPLAAWYGSWIRSKEGVPELVAHPEPRTTRSVI